MSPNMTGSLRLGLLGLLTGQALAQSADVITEDSYFYGQSPPSYPSPNATGTGAWADAYTKAAALVSQLTLDEKVSSTTSRLQALLHTGADNIGKTTRPLYKATYSQYPGFFDWWRLHHSQWLLRIDCGH